MSKGYLFLIGGGEDCNLIFERLFELAGGKDNTRLAIIPAASSHVGGTIIDYTEYFVNELGLHKNNVWCVPLAFKDDPETKLIDESLWENNAYNSEIADKIKDFNVVFFVGGDQRFYVDTLLKNNQKSPLIKSVFEIYNTGGIIAGTSAGTNIIGKTSIAGGRSEEAMQNHYTFDRNLDDGDELLILEGFGFVDNIITDTHFDTRGRLGRLIKSAALTNNRYGIGISEKTAVIYYPDSTIEIVGYGDVLVTDLLGSKLISKPIEFIHVFNVRVNMFTHGDKFNIETKKFTPNINKNSIKFTPYFDANDYHISLNVFKECETSSVLVNYMLDNEADDVIALIDYENYHYEENKSSFIRFHETDNSDSFFGKYTIDNNEEIKDFYSGLNILTDIIPFEYINSNKENKNINALLFSIEKQLQIVVFDNYSTSPICEAKIEIYNSDNKLVYKTGTDKFGRIKCKTELNTNENYNLIISFDGYSVNQNFTFIPNMKGLFI